MPEVELPNPEEIQEKAESSFGRRVALVTAVFAVMLALAGLGGNNATKEMLLAQQQSSDQWAFYQAKVIREHQYRSQKMRLEADLIERGPSLRPEAREKLEALLRKYDEEEKRFGAEKKEIEQAAKRLEAARDRFQTKDPYFDVAEVFLQIAIVMSSVSILSRSRPIFFFSVLLALIGATLTLNGYALLFQLPFLHHGH
ncbi:MAG TPA: DUF4337 domain-containing protein [Methylomirabilota bacterium]|jgi:hypothetical protein|nr:DUF4337 domain-containing protein [Methylomirabilota bacterium]